MVKPAIIGYVPRSDISPKICCPSAFVENIRKFRTAHELVLFTDGNWADMVKIPDPEKAVNPNAVLANGQPNTFALNNLIFFTALRIAKHRGFTHLLYLEADCRVGRDDWDQILFEAHFRQPEPVIASGSVVIFNPCAAGRESQNRWFEYISKVNTRRNFPIPCYGFGGQSYTHGSSIFTNGALGVYDLRFINSFFPEALGDAANPQAMPSVPPVEKPDWATRLGAGPANKTAGNSVALAEKSFAWDFLIGKCIWERFGIHSYDCVSHTPQVYSSFGDVLTTPEERLAMLRNGDVVGIHQIKGPETI